MPTVFMKKRWTREGRSKAAEKEDADRLMYICQFVRVFFFPNYATSVE